MPWGDGLGALRTLGTIYKIQISSIFFNIFGLEPNSSIL